MSARLKRATRAPTARASRAASSTAPYKQPSSATRRSQVVEDWKPTGRARSIMRSLMYRDLPGGPTMVNFADRISSCFLCSQCGMLSLNVFYDPGYHVFCKTCLDEQTAKHGKLHIYCTHERKNIPLDEMFENSDVFDILRYQFVDCPNQPQCKVHVPLENLQDHYVSCKRRVQCPSGDKIVETKKWKEHPCVLEAQHAVPKGAGETGASTKVVEDHYVSCKKIVQYPSCDKSIDTKKSKEHLCVLEAQHAVPNGAEENGAWTKVVKKKGRKNKRKPQSRDAPGQAVVTTQPDQQAAACRAAPPAKESTIKNKNWVPASVQIMCDYCHRTVKDGDLTLHLRKCDKAPEPCVYCEALFPPGDISVHILGCPMNPESVTMEHEATLWSGAMTRQPRSYASVVGKPRV